MGHSDDLTYIFVALLAILVASSLAFGLDHRVKLAFHNLVNGGPREGFSTIAVDRDLMPRCFTRDTDAQAILLALKPAKAVDPDAFGELSLILQKMLCVDADVTGAGVGGYQSFQLPFVTQHDLEPAASLVGRCLKGALRSRDLELTIDKWEKRGAVLIQSLAGCLQGGGEAVRSESLTRFRTVAKRSARTIGQACTSARVSMDIPAGPRDPGYTVPKGLEEQGPYAIRGEVQYI
jgi:hypothetical protein